MTVKLLHRDNSIILSVWLQPRHHAGFEEPDSPPVQASISQEEEEGGGGGGGGRRRREGGRGLQSGHRPRISIPLYLKNGQALKDLQSCFNTTA